MRTLLKKSAILSFLFLVYSGSSLLAKEIDVPDGAPLQNLGNPDHIHADKFEGRDIVLYIPSQLPPEGQRAMVVALHGGGGNAHFMETHLFMDEVAEKNGFIVAYLNGTHAGKLIPSKMHAWNAGGECCGLPYKKNVDDVGYVVGTTNYITQKYGIDKNRVFGIGHSNGSMMTELLMCTANIYQATVAIAGPLNIETSDCPNSKGKRILAIHGGNDRNVPVAGGIGSKGVTGIPYRSEAYEKAVFEHSGASFTLQVIPGGDHALENLDAAVKLIDGMSLSEKAARFFGLVSTSDKH